MKFMVKNDVYKRGLIFFIHQIVGKFRHFSKCVENESYSYYN